MLCTKFLKTSYLPDKFSSTASLRHWHGQFSQTEEGGSSSLRNTGRTRAFWRCKATIMWTEIVVHTWKRKYYVVLNLKCQTMSFIFSALPKTFLILSEMICLVLSWALSHFCTTFLYDWHSLEVTFYGRL